MMEYPPAAILDAHTRPLPSNIVNEEYELSIWLPESYASSEQAYPVLYVLDSPVLFGSAVEGARLENWEGAVPEMIVVGVGKRMESLEEWWDARWRDYSPVPLPGIPSSGFADAFLNFLEQECLPFIDANYRTRADDRIIWGTSMGGLLAIYSLFNRPHLFSRYIANAPAFCFNNTRAFDYEPALATLSLPAVARLFVSVGALDQEFLPGVERFMEALSVRSLPGLRYQSTILDGLGHHGAVPAFYLGIAAVYAM